MAAAEDEPLPAVDHAVIPLQNGARGQIGQYFIVLEV
jgi:hypothetical protein